MREKHWKWAKRKRMSWRMWPLTNPYLRFNLSFVRSQHASLVCKSIWCNGTDTQGSVINIRYAHSQKKPFSTLNDWLCDSMYLLGILRSFPPSLFRSLSFFLCVCVSRSHLYRHQSMLFLFLSHVSCLDFLFIQQSARKLLVPHVFFCHLIFIWLWLSVHLHFHLILNVFKFLVYACNWRVAHKIMLKHGR